MHKRISRGRSREIPTSHHLFLDAGGASCEPIQQKHHRRSAQIFARLRFGARHARAFRLPAGGNQRAANEARDVASLWKRRGLTSILKRRVSPPPPSAPPPTPLFSLALCSTFSPSPPPGSAALYICLFHSKLETRRGARTDSGSGRATLKR